MSLRSNFGLALQLVRKKKGLTQEDFSIHSSRTYISTLERGMKSPTLDKIDQIALVLDIHPISLIVLAYSNNESKKAMSVLKHLSNEIKALDKIGR